MGQIHQSASHFTADKGQSGPTDEALCQACRQGDAGALTTIVERYQTLICAVAYSCTGDQAISEDIAQDTFVAAWRSIKDLQDDTKLRPWLCGIARRLSSKALRKLGREVPSEMPAEREVDARANALEAVLNREMQQLVWAALAQIPQTYREPLVLYYREDRSTQQVAKTLDITDDVVHQRLSRGRKYLKQSVMRLVENTLEHTKSARNLASGVLAALGLHSLTGSAQAAAATRGNLEPAANTGSNPATSASALRTAGALMSTKAIKFSVAAVIIALLAWGGYRKFTENTPDTATDNGATTRNSKSNQHNEKQRPRQFHRQAQLGGRVIDAETGLGIPGALISVSDTDLVQAAVKQPGKPVEDITTLTDTNGSWRVESLPHGHYYAAATKIGYQLSHVHTVEIDAGEKNHDIAITLVPGTMHLRGRVLDVEGGPIAGALVSAAHFETSVRHIFEDNKTPIRFASARSDRDGNYVLPLDQGMYVIQVSHTDYSSTLSRVQFHLDDQAYDATLVPASTIEGIVLDETTQEPASGVIITATQSGGADNADAPPTVVTDIHGKFRLPHVPAGRLTLRAQADDKVEKAPTVLDVGIADHIGDVILRVRSAPHATCRVIDSNNQPVPDIAVTLMSFDGTHGDMQGLPRWTDQDGRCDLKAVRAGNYLASAMGPGIVSLVMHPVTIDTGNDGTHFELQVSRGYAVSGTISDQTPAYISLRPKQTTFANLMSLTLGIKTHPGSSDFRLAGVAPGRYEVLATTEDGRGGSVEIEVTNGDISNLRIPLVTRGEIVGQVSYQSGAPAINVLVNAELKSVEVTNLAMLTRQQGDWTDSNGRFHIKGVEEGEYTLSVFSSQHSKGPLQASPLSFANSKTSIPRVSVHNGSTTEQALVVRDNRAELKGLAVDEQGKPIADAWIYGIASKYADSKGRQQRASDRTPVALSDSEGRFRIRGVRAGEYTLVANHPSSQRRGRAQSVSTNRAVTVTLSSLATVSVQVTAGGVATSGLSGQLVLTKPRTADGEYHERRQHRAHTRANQISWNRVLPGSYTLVVENDYGAASTTVSIKNGDKTELALDLQQWGKLSGRIVDAHTDEPVPFARIAINATIPAGNARVENWLLNDDIKADATGNFSLVRIPPGELTLVAIPPGSAVEALTKSARSRGNQKLRLTLSQGETKDVGDLRLTRGSDASTTP